MASMSARLIRHAGRPGRPGATPGRCSSGPVCWFSLSSPAMSATVTNSSSRTCTSTPPAACCHNPPLQSGPGAGRRAGRRPLRSGARPLRRPGVAPLPRHRRHPPRARRPPDAPRRQPHFAATVIGRAGELADRGDHGPSRSRSTAANTTLRSGSVIASSSRTLHARASVRPASSIASPLRRRSRLSAAATRSHRSPRRRASDSRFFAGQGRRPERSGRRRSGLGAISAVDKRARRQDLDVADVRLEKIAIPRHERRGS
jgi:hypothetical protein